MTDTTAQSNRLHNPSERHSTVSAVNASTLSPLALRALAVARILLGWIFLWTFMDKLFGLGFATSTDKSWLAGSSPTTGYLSSSHGTFSQLFTAMGGNGWADWLFMGGMAGLGIALVLGIGMRVAAIGAVALLGMLWLSSLPLAQNPFVDQHLVYLATVIALAVARAGDTWGLGRPWSRTGLVRAVPILR